MITRGELLRLLRFAIVGGGATATHLLVAWLCFWRYPQASEFGVNLVAFSLAFWVSFIGHRFFTFNKPGSVRKFLIVALFSYGMNNLLLTVFIWMGLGGWPAIAIATLTVPLATYILARIWVFV